jgi:hypothetical protein
MHLPNMINFWIIMEILIALPQQRKVNHELLGLYITAKRSRARFFALSKALFAYEST